MKKSASTSRKTQTVRKKSPAKKASSRPSALSHHRHTGQMLHRHHTSYPVLAFLLILVGVFLAAFTFSVGAADIQVRATAEGPLPPTAAIITKPANGETFQSVPISVEGTCPAGLFYVKLYRNNLFSGSAPCNGSGTFMISSDLFEGSNELKAQIVNGADQLGPASDPVQVTYTPPLPAAKPQSNQTPTNVEQLVIVSKVTYVSGRPNELTEWEFELAGGLAPYAISIDWGDGETAVISRSENGSFKATHRYAAKGSFFGTYPVVIKASDAQGNTAYLQMFAIVNEPAAAVGLTEFTPPQSPFSGSDLSRILLISWPLFVLAVLLAVSFWLGERREFEILARAGRLKALK
jgi:hypothetical protein